MQKFSNKFYEKKFSKKITNYWSRPIKNLFLARYNNFFKEVGKKSFELVELIEKNKLSPKEAYQYFAFLDIYLEDNFSFLKNLQEKSEKCNLLNNLLLEAKLFYDLDKNYNADLESMKRNAKKL